MGYTRPRANFIFWGALSPEKASQSPAVADSKVDHAEPARRAEEGGEVEDHGGRHRKGPIGHCDQTNAVFAFWQVIVDLARFLKNLGGRGRAGRGPQLHRRAPASGARRRRSALLAGADFQNAGRAGRDEALRRRRRRRQMRQDMPRRKNDTYSVFPQGSVSSSFQRSFRTLARQHHSGGNATLAGGQNLTLGSRAESSERREGAVAERDHERRKKGGSAGFAFMRALRPKRASNRRSLPRRLGRKGRRIRRSRINHDGAFGFRQLPQLEDRTHHQRFLFSTLLHKHALVRAK